MVAPAIVSRGCDVGVNGFPVARPNTNVRLFVVPERRTARSSRPSPFTSPTPATRETTPAELVSLRLGFATLKNWRTATSSTYQPSKKLEEESPASKTNRMRIVWPRKGLRLSVALTQEGLFTSRPLLRDSSGV